MQRTGSHQNIMTIRLIEALALSNLVPVLLDPALFPNGLFTYFYPYPYIFPLYQCIFIFQTLLAFLHEGDQFHHHKDYMSELRRGLVSPFNFHMCWTKNKGEKIANFKSIDMWYLNETCPFYGAYSDFLNTNHSSIMEKKVNKVRREADSEDDDDN